MKPLAVDIERFGSLGGEEIEMAFDVNSMAHIMSVLTDLYSDSELAIIREYSTNAYDSHVEAGVNAPIEITKPTHLHPTLRIKDYGVGMSRGDIINIYSKYGASTKRETDEQSGTLGLGGKSALTYTSQFAITAVKDGIKTIVNVSRTESGTGVMELVDSHSTSEPNGVTISIEVRDVYSVGRKVDEFFSYWDQGTVLIDGKPPATIEGISITDTITLRNGSGGDVIVMGNVPYRLDRHHRIAANDYWSSNYSVVARVPIGTVAFTPNREDLRYTKQTERSIEEVRNEFLKNFNSKLQQSIDQEDTPAKALQKYVECLNYSSISGFAVKMEWRGQSFADALNVKHMVFKSTATRDQVRTRGSMEAHSVFNSIFITGFKNSTLSSAYKQKIRVLISGHSHTDVRLLGDDALPEWFGEAVSYTWDDVRSVSLASSQRTYLGRTGPQKYQVLSDDSFNKEDYLDNTRPIYFDTYADYGSSAYWLSKVFDKTDQVVLISRNRWDKFRRDYPNAVRIGSGVAIKRQEFIDTVPKDVVESYTLADKNILRRMDESRVDDPELKSSIILAKKDISQYLDKFGAISIDYAVKASGLKKYPLIDGYSLVHNNNHVYIYINAVYNESKGS